MCTSPIESHLLSSAASVAPVIYRLRLMRMYLDRLCYDSCFSLDPVLDGIYWAPVSCENGVRAHYSMNELHKSAEVEVNLRYNLSFSQITVVLSRGFYDRRKRLSRFIREMRPQVEFEMLDE